MLTLQPNLHTKREFISARMAGNEFTGIKILTVQVSAQKYLAKYQNEVIYMCAWQTQTWLKESGSPWIQCRDLLCAKLALHIPANITSSTTNYGNIYQHPTYYYKLQNGNV